MHILNKFIEYINIYLYRKLETKLNILNRHRNYYRYYYVLYSEVHASVYVIIKYI